MFASIPFYWLDWSLNFWGAPPTLTESKEPIPIDDYKFSLMSLIYLDGAGVFWFVYKNLLFLNL